MLDINWSDVISTLQSMRGHLIAIGVIIAAAIIIMIAVRKLPKATKFAVRWQAVIGMLLGITVVANLICTGPLRTILTLASGSGSLSEESIEMALETNKKISDEGIVLLKNENSVLPLNENTKVNVFGWASAYPVYGGTGSGAMNDAYAITDLLTGLHNAGIETNEELTSFYQEYREGRPLVGMWEQDWTLPEPTVDSYSEDLLENAKEFSDTAIIVLSRSGGEHIDLPRDVATVSYENNGDYEDFPEGTTYLEPSQTELDMIELVTSNFEHVIFVANSANVMELGIVNEYDNIEAALWVPGTGQNGFDAFGDIVKGTVNPSGKTTDTLVADLMATPTFNTFTENEYDNMDEYIVPDSDAYMPGSKVHFINYNEGIYVGYKFYETAAEEGLINYDEAVVYPFGYGLSYTTFTQEMGDVTVADGVISFDVTVTNTGDTAGKDVVEVYYNPPYTNGGIEKASVNLVAFDKTEELAPGESETVSIEFNEEDMASYDTYGAGAYVLEQGDYVISINSDSHTVIDSEVVTVDETVTYDGDNARSTDKTAAENAFADFSEGDYTYLSRADGFANYEEVTAEITNFSMNEESKAGFTDNSHWEVEETDAQMPTTGADNGLTLADYRGVAYDDESWEDLLDQLTISDMQNLVAFGGYQTAAAESVGKVLTTDVDGPSALNNNFTGVGSIGYACAVMIANTWNEDLSYEFGDGIGTMAEEMNVNGWYAPAVNTHRNAFTGRNFEYYSEDGLLAGKLAGQAVKGAADHGVYAYVKHFAMNEMETNRWGKLTTWSTEQAIREIYLKPFEILVKEFDTHAIMTSYNYIGNQWAGASNSLLNTVLRGEWGFEGFTLTDYFANFDYMSMDRAVYNGGDVALATVDQGANIITDTDNAQTVLNMRRAAKNVMYTVVNSNAYAEGAQSSGLLMFEIILIVADLIVAALIILLELFVVRRGYQKRVEK